ncbi:hypothetical protein RB653_000937 [Dictyostelium firmibasis]|uniref:Uncharacterized protein n=1 Tax=Dictyostelium firmibasis TaxID=79012 RepID=A0AAN7U3F8_9MYCE
MKLFILLLILIINILINESSGNEYVNFIPYLNDECLGDEIGIGYSGLLSTCLPSIDSHQNYLFTLKPKNVIEWTVFKYFNIQDSCNLNKTKILQPSFTSKIGSCISSEYINLDSKTSLSSPIYYKISITKNSPYISIKSIVNSFTLEKTCSSSNSPLIQYFTNHLNVNYKLNDKASYHCINDNPYIKKQLNPIEQISQECSQFKNGPILIKGLRFSSGGSGGSGESSGQSTGGDQSTGQSTGGGSGTIDSGGSSSTGNSGISSAGDTDTGTTETSGVTTATSATSGGVTSGGDDDGGGDSGGLFYTIENRINFLNYNPKSSSHQLTQKLFKKTYCSK